MTTVLAFGTFDLFHPGHEFFLREARAFGDRLVVSLPSDATVKHLKGCPPVHTFDERRAALLSSGLVDDVEEGDGHEDFGVFSGVDRAEPRVIALGYDQQALRDALETWKTRYQKSVDIVTIPAYKPDEFKSSILRDQL